MDGVPRIDVYSNATMKRIQDMVDTMTRMNENPGNMLSFGAIYVGKNMSGINSGNIDEGDANLLGHKVVHLLQ